jgi:hypothetical protein
MSPVLQGIFLFNFVISKFWKLFPKKQKNSKINWKIFRNFPKKKKDIFFGKIYPVGQFDSQNG